MTPLVVVISSPSGGGKSSIAKKLLGAHGHIGYSISATTRAPRGEEQEGVHYYFLHPDAFERQVQSGEFLEHAIYNGNRYGTLASEVRRVVGGGQHVIMDIEVVGARLIRSHFPDAVLIFVVPPSGATLLERLNIRGTDSEAAIQGRLEQALEELSVAAEYDYLVVNEDLDEAVRAVEAILAAESRKMTRQQGLTSRLATLRTEIASLLTGMTQRRPR